MTTAPTVTCPSCESADLIYLGMKSSKDNDALIGARGVRSDYWKCPACKVQYGIGRFVDHNAIAVPRKTEPYVEEEFDDEVEWFPDEDGDEIDYSDLESDPPLEPFLPRGGGDPY